MSTATPEPDPPPVPRPIVERLAPLAPKKPRKANQRDLLRVDEYFRLLDEGVDPYTAAWRVLSHPDFGIGRWRGAPASARRRDITLARTMASHLRRAKPALVEDANDLATARFCRLTEKALAVYDEVLSGHVEDPAKSRVMFDAAKSVVETFGVGSSHGGGPPVQAVQVNTTVSLGASRDAEPEYLRYILDDPELLEEAEALVDKIESRRAGERGMEGDAGDDGASPGPGPMEAGPAPELPEP